MQITPLLPCKKYTFGYNSFIGKIEEVSMDDSQTVDRINRWVKDATKEKIEKIVDGPLDVQTVTILVNAIYFNGDWKYTFDKSKTKQGTFRDEHGNTNKQDFMELETKLPYFEIGRAHV